MNKAAVPESLTQHRQCIGDILSKWLAERYALLVES